MCGRSDQRQLQETTTPCVFSSSGVTGSDPGCNAVLLLVAWEGWADRRTMKIPTGEPHSEQGPEGEAECG